MEKKANPVFMGIVLCITFAVILFTFQSCKRDRSSIDQSISLGISADDSHPSWSPDGTRIVYTSRRNNPNAEIYIMNEDGSNKTRLTDNPAFDRCAFWSPDGNRIVFVSNRDGNQEIYMMDTDGSNQARLTENPARDSFPSWSPDGSRIIFQSDRDGNWEIYVMNSDGSNITRLTDNPADDKFPSYSPDETRIAFFSDRDENWEVYFMNSDGSNQIRLTENAAYDGNPSWSSDGSRLIFHSNRDGNFEIYTMNSDGSNPTRLTDEPAEDGHPSWSPGDRKIAFMSDRDFVQEVYVMNADGSNPINLTNNAPVDATVGSAPLPRSELNLKEIPYKIVFESYRETASKENWDICLIDADGSDFVNLTSTPEIDEMYPHASPDGRRICFEAVKGEDLESKSQDVYIMNIDGTGRVKIAENASQPCWSADGRYIAYLPGEYPRYDPDMLANKGLEVYNLETGEVNRHPNDEVKHLFNLCWSPGGKWFTSSSMEGNIAFKARDKTKMILTVAGCRPDISPEGTRLVWNVEDWIINTGTLNLDSPQSSVTDHKVVVACERENWVYHADWSPDGNYLAFSYAPSEGSYDVGHKAPGANICICDLSTGKWTQITTDGMHNKEPDWVPVQVKE
jgi:Tol biopolymer transport system component